MGCRGGGGGKTARIRTTTETKTVIDTHKRDVSLILGTVFKTPHTFLSPQGRVIVTFIFKEKTILQLCEM